MFSKSSWWKVVIFDTICERRKVECVYWLTWLFLKNVEKTFNFWSVCDCEFSIFWRVEKNWINRYNYSKIEAAKDFRLSKNNDVFTKFLNDMSKEINIRFLFYWKVYWFNKVWFFNIYRSRIKCKILRRTIVKNDDDDDYLFDFFAQFFNVTMFSLNESMKFENTKDNNKRKKIVIDIEKNQLAKNFRNEMRLQKIFDEKTFAIETKMKSTTNVIDTKKLLQQQKQN